MEKTLKLEVTEKEFEILFAALGELPSKITYNLITKLKVQQQEQEKKDEK